MIRKRILWAGLAALMVLPSFGCRHCRRDNCSSRSPAFYAPTAVAAPACNSCQTSGASPIIVSPG